MSEPVLVQLRAVEKSVSDAKRRLDSLSSYIEKLKKEIISSIEAQIEQARYTRFKPEFLPNFLAEPYIIMPKRTVKGKAVEWYVIVPRFIDFQLGWLERSTPSYNIFIVNQYVQWFTEIPKELKERFQLKPLPVKVADGLLLTPEETQEEAWKRYKRYLSRREGKQAIRIKRGNEFKLIAQIIEDGSLPFIPRKVEPQDYREPETLIKLRDYQEEAWKKFLQTGAVGIYWPFGCGKSFFGLYACASLKGRKLVIVPTLTLKEQWLENLRNYTNIAYEV
jgi:DNA excision repair protein ERCC-3